MKSGSLEIRAAKTSSTSPTTSSNISTSQPALKAAVIQHPKAAAYCFALASCSVVTGYYLSIVNGITALPSFQHDYGIPHGHRYIIPSKWLSLWGTLGPLGGMIGSILVASLQDCWGRRIPLALSGLIALIAVSLLYSSNLASNLDSRRGIFLAGKIVSGLANGIIEVQASTYISEVAPSCLRGPALALPRTFTAVGHLLGAGIIFSRAGIKSSKAYTDLFVSQWPFAVLPLVLGFMIPESSVHLIRKNQFDKALQAQARLSISESEARRAVDRMQENAVGEKRAVSYVDCFRSTDLRRTILVLFVSWIPVFFGLSIWSSTGYFLQLVGMTPRNSLIIAIFSVGLVLLSNITSVWALSYFRRRSLLIYSLGAASFLWTVMGISGIWSGTPTLWITAVTLLLVVIVCSTGAWPASSTVAGELSSLRLRSKTQGLGGLSSHLSNVVFGNVVPYIFGPDAGDLKAKTGFVFAGLCLLTTGVVWMIIPEMKGREASEIDRMFELKLPARRFQKWSPEETTEIAVP